MTALHLTFVCTANYQAAGLALITGLIYLHTQPETLRSGQHRPLESPVDEKCHEYSFHKPLVYQSLRAHGRVESDWKGIGIVSNSCAQAKDRIGIGFANPIATPGLSRC